MPIDVKNYEKWAKKFKAEGGEPCIRRYLKHLVYTESNSITKDTRLSSQIQENQQLLNDICR